MAIFESARQKINLNRKGHKTVRKEEMTELVIDRLAGRMNEKANRGGPTRFDHLWREEMHILYDFC
jgi:hypothetical protein